MVHQIHIHNKSAHDQTFEVHGWHNNQNITVKGGDITLIPAPDGSSGAIIALHEGHEGEQAEITKNGFGGMSTFVSVAPHFLCHSSETTLMANEKLISLSRQ